MQTPPALQARSSAIAAALADPQATAGLPDGTADADAETDEPQRAQPWDDEVMDDDGFWDEGSRATPVTEVPIEDEALTNLRRSLADALERNKTQLAATLQRATDDYPQEPAPPPAPGPESSSEARKTMRDISEGMCWLERTFHQHMSKITAQRETLETNISTRCTEQANTLASMRGIYEEQVKAEERLFEQFMDDCHTAA